MVKKVKNRLVSLAEAYGYYSQSAMEIVVAVGGGVWLGQWLDRKWDVLPIFTVIGALVGSIGAFISLFRTVARRNQKSTKKRSSDIKKQ